MLKPNKTTIVGPDFVGKALPKLGVKYHHFSQKLDHKTKSMKHVMIERRDKIKLTSST